MIYLYLLPEGLKALQPRVERWLEEEEKGKRRRRVVCNTWGLVGREPVEKRDVGNVRLLLYEG